MYSEGLKSLLRGDTERAVERFKAALKRNPRLNLAHRGLGLAYEKLGQTAKALGAYKRYLAARPDAPDRSSIERRIEKLER
jgi:regulator of sirC expression with transglutaminase-like and TPR domain